MTITLYYMPQSPGCRSVMLLAKHLGVKLDLKFMHVLMGQHLEPSFLKINPQRTIPTIDDDGFILWESRAILTYLVSMYAKNDSLYPADPQKRAIVNQRLHFDINYLYRTIYAYYSSVFLKKGRTTEENLPSLEESFTVLNGFLENVNFVAGDELTVADYTIVVNVCTAMAFGFDINNYDNIKSWYERCRKVMEKDGFKEFNDDQAMIISMYYKMNLKN